MNSLSLRQRIKWIIPPTNMKSDASNFYRHSKDFDFLTNMTSRVPADATVMTQNNILGHFSHQKGYLMKVNYEEQDPDYILFDLREGQNAAHLLEDPRYPIPVIFEKVKGDSTYEMIWHEGDQYIFRKK